MAVGPRDVDDLLPLALSRPREALARARAVLAGRPGPHDASVAHQAAAIVLREFGDAEAGVRELRAALRLARRTGSAEREADVLASLGVALVYAGRTAAGLAAFDRAVQRSTGVLAARVLARRGVVLYTLGRYPAALDDLRHAVVVLRRAGDLLWTARALNNRATDLLGPGVDQPGRCRFRFRRTPVLRSRAGSGSDLSGSTIARWSPSHREISQPRWPSSMRRLPATGGSRCRPPRCASTGALCCWRRGWPTMRWPKRKPR